jgi:magnesium transporter
MSRKTKGRRRVTRIRRRTRPGAAPGSVVADPGAPAPVIAVMAYGPDNVREQRVETPDAVADFLGNYPVVWINVDGLGDAAVIRRLGEILGLHQLAMEDVVNTHQRAKVEDYGTNIFIVGRMVETVEHLDTEQLALFLGANYVLTFQERAGDCFDPVRERIRKRGKIAGSGPDYLAYALIDAFIDNYFPALESYGERLESMEEAVVSQPGAQLVASIHDLRRDLLTLRRAIWPLRDAISTLIRDSDPLVKAETRLYLRDCYDHTVQIIDLLESYRDVASGLMEVYLSSVSNRLNEIMKILTMFTAFFIPLSLVAGIYGMNFNPGRSPLNMPELNWYYGYPLALGLMGCIALCMLVFFRRKGWVGANRGQENRSRSAPTNVTSGDPKRIGRNTDAEATLG